MPNTLSENISMDISVVIPFLNEQENLQPLVEELEASFAPLLEQGKIYELIFVDDGSSDGGVALLSKEHERNPRIKVVEFRRNFGQTAAMAAGLDFSQGDVVITMDADRQNDPEDIPLLLQKIDEGFDLVCGWRRDRQDTYWSRKLPSLLANKLISKITDVSLHDYGCTLKAMRKDVAKGITLYGELHRFIPAVASFMGVRIAEVAVNHRARTAGESKYGLSRVFRVILDLITVKFLLSYSGRPIHFFGIPGLICGSTGFLITAYLAFGRLFFGMSLSERPLLMFALVLFLLGVQFIIFGLLGELQIRTYYESQDKPIYHVRSKIGFENDPN
jgi:glycosyltransferase involved in cell wall biosynthesis